MDKVETDMKRLVYFYQGKCVKGRDSIVLGDQRGGCPSSLNPLTLQGKLYRGSGPLTLWGIGVHSGPGDLHPQSLVKLSLSK